MADPCPGIDSADESLLPHLVERWYDETYGRGVYVCPATGRHWLRRDDVLSAFEVEDPAAFERIAYDPSLRGWRMDGTLWARCVDCDAFVLMSPTGHGCPCGGIHIDADAARFGSRHGDAAIEVYRRR